MIVPHVPIMLDARRGPSHLARIGRISVSLHTGVASGNAPLPTPSNTDAHTFSTLVLSFPPVLTSVL